jgi:cobalt-zinc-cadmium efflux system membrane fusion protein
MITLLPLALAACGNKEGTEAAPRADGQKHGAAEHAAAEHGEGQQHIELSAAQIKAAGIEVAKVGQVQIREVLPLYGAIAPNAERVREVRARFSGAIRSVSRRVGDSIKQGEELATVESDESLETYKVVAPLTGVVTERNANPGEQTGAKALFTVADLSSVWVELSLFPRDLPQVHVGQQVRISSPDAAMSAMGKVVYVAPFGTTASQTLTARVLLDNPDRAWAPGLYVMAEVVLAESPTPTGIRSEAIQTLDGRTVVFAKTKDGFEPRPIRIGRSDNEHSEVLEGLSGGEHYAARNSFILKAELGKGEAEHDH